MLTGGVVDMYPSISDVDQERALEMSLFEVDYLTFYKKNTFGKRFIQYSKTLEK